jgi:hypothetical protein
MWRRMNKPTSALAALLLMGMAGCVDLDVVNQNDPDAGRTLRTPRDIEALIAGAYSRWVHVLWYDGPSMMMSNASGEHVAPWGNAGMEMYARIPRIPTNNAAGAPNVTNLTYAWFESYGAIAAIHDGLRALADSAELRAALGRDTLRARAYGKYMQGLAHATVAVVYDSGFVYDETVVIPSGVDPLTIVHLKGHQEVMDSALSYFAQAISLAASDTFTIPESWMSQDVSSATLIRLAHSEAARFRAALARTPAERAAVDWNAVRADATAGITADWNNVSDCNLGTFCDDGLLYRLSPGWQMQNNWVVGMADTSGAYQTWIGTTLLSKQPFLIFTPDTRWPQGANEAGQVANPGAYYTVNQGDDGTRIWNRPDRGTWRWSYYYITKEPFFTTHGILGEGATPLVTVREMKALIAEADYRASNLGAVATFVNETRTLHGLNATDAGGTNTSCVPKLPNGTCGDLWEMFKWEKRLETQFAGPLRSGWWLDGRAWGDLMQGTLVQFPVPYREMQLLQQPAYNFGGVGGQYGAPIGTYGY